MDGGGGFDIVDYSNSAAVTIDMLNNVWSGGHAAGDIVSNVEGVRGSANNDSIAGDNSSNTLYGDDGTDILVGNDGNDTIYGGASWTVTGDGGDSIDGGAGNDLLYGNDGNDTIIGGTGTIRSTAERAPTPRSSAATGAITRSRGTQALRLTHWLIVGAAHPMERIPFGGREFPVC